MLFTKPRWVGEFFLPDCYDQRFSGEIQYTPEQGVILSYQIAGHEVPPDSEVVYGILSSGEKCTLLGSFSPRAAGLNLRNGFVTRLGKNSFACLAIGDFLASDERIDNINFSLTNLQEFFYPSGFKDQVKYSEEPIYALGTSFGSMDVRNEASFGLLFHDITSQVYSEDAAALAELNKAFQEIEDKYSKSPFMLKKDISYRIGLSLDPALELQAAYERITDFSSLFALLIYNPVYPESIRFTKCAADESLSRIELYPSMALNPRTIERCTQAQSHLRMPITKSTIALDSIVKAWLKSEHQTSPIVSSIQNETGFRTTHDVHGEIILYATQLESISHDAGQKPKKKYEFPLAEYASQKLRARLMKILDSASLHDTAVAIGDLRNEVAHVGRPKVWLNKLSLSQLVEVSQCLQLTIIGFMLNSLGVPRDVIINYQDIYRSDI